MAIRMQDLNATQYAKVIEKMKQLNSSPSHIHAMHKFIGAQAAQDVIGMQAALNEMSNIYDDIIQQEVLADAMIEEEQWA